MGFLYQLMEQIRRSSVDDIKLRTTQIGNTKVLEKRCTPCREWRPLNDYQDQNKGVHNESNCALCRHQLVAVK